MAMKKIDPKYFSFDQYRSFLFCNKLLASYPVYDISNLKLEKQRTNGNISLSLPSFQNLGSILLWTRSMAKYSEHVTSRPRAEETQISAPEK